MNAPFKPKLLIVEDDEGLQRQLKWAYEGYRVVIAGDRDYTPLAYKRAYLAQLRNARLEVIEDSGHATPLDQPQRLNQLLQAFIAEHSPPLSA